MSLERLSSAIRSLLTRAKVTDSRIGGRTLLQISGLDGETTQVVELLLPPGYVARPLVGSDALLMQVLGSRDHLVALGGDFAGNVVDDLLPGEFGLTTGTQTILLRQTGITINTPLTLTVTAAEGITFDTPLLKVTGDIEDQNGAHGNLGALRSAYDSHTHPDVQNGAGNTGTTSAPI